MPSSAAPTPLPSGEWPSSLGEVLADMKGRPINVHGLMAHHPDLLGAWWPFRNYTVKGGALPQRERELAILTVARHMQNDYEWQSHVDRGITAGITREEIQSIRSGDGEWSPKDALLISAVQALLTHHAIPDDCRNRLQEFFSIQQVMDIIFIHGAYVTLGCLLNTFEVPIDEDVSTRLRGDGLDDSTLSTNLKSMPDVDLVPSGSVLYRSPGERYPLAASASGMVITDSSGKDYLDMSGGAAVSILGHGHPEVIAAIRDQLETLAFAHTAFFTNGPQERLAALLAARFGEPGARVYFASGGSEANETALKLAWQYWAARGQPGRKVIISREHSYHGNTLGALSVSGNRGRRRASAAPLVDWPRVPPCYEYRERESGESIEQYAIRAADALETAILECGAERIAAFICEPIVGSSLGVVPAEKGYLRRIREICDRYEVLFIADEIMCGSGRTGRYFAHAHDEVLPDIVTLAKGIGGGYMPLAAVVVRQRVYGHLERSGFVHGHTYVGHAAACAAGVAVMGVIERNGLLERTETMGASLRAALEDAFREHPHVGDIRCRGLFAGIELVADRASRRGFVDAGYLPGELRMAALDRGLICYPGGIDVDGRTVPHIMLAPPMIVSESQIGDGIERLAAAIDQTLGS